MAKRSKRKAARSALPEPKHHLPEWLPQVAILAALAIAVYCNSISNGFISDDNWQLLRNRLITDPANLPKLLGSGVWSFLGVKGNYYRPLQFAAYMLLYECAGFHAAAFHAFMVLLHGLNTVLLYFLVRRLAAGRIALAAAALFAVHPIHTEAVDWIAALPDVLVTTLALLGISWLARQEAAPHGFQIIGHCGLYLLALLSKETGVMLLPLYGGLGFFCLGRRWQEFRLNARLYAAMAATLGIYLAMRWAALGGLAPAQEMYFHLSALEFALSAVVTAAQYLARLLFPADLNYFHIFHPTQAITPGLLISVATLAAVAMAFLRVRTALVSYGIFWMAVTIAPPLDLTGVGQNVLAERYLYLPSAGFCWIAAWAWDWWAQRQPRWAKFAAAGILVACAAETMSRNRDWRDDFTLFQKTVRQSPASALVQDELASLYVERSAFDTALQHERLAVQYEPGTAMYRKKLGYLLLYKDPRAAIPEFRKALELEPSAVQGHSDLAMALEAAGEIGEAADEYGKVLQLQPQNREAKEGYQRVMASHHR